MMLNMALNTLMQNLRNMIVEQEISLLKFQGANVTWSEVIETTWMEMIL